MKLSPAQLRALRDAAARDGEKWRPWQAVLDHKRSTLFSLWGKGLLAGDIRDFNKAEVIWITDAGRAALEKGKT